MDSSSTRRAFFCRDDLWQAFSELAARRGTTLDALLNEAMSNFLTTQNQFGGGDQNVYGRQPYNQVDASPAQNQQAYGGHQPIASHMQQQRSMQPQNNYGRAPVANSQSYGPGSQLPSSPKPSQQLQGQRVPPPTPGNYRRPPSIFEEPVSESLNKNGQPQPMVLASLTAPQQPPYQSPQRQNPQNNRSNFTGAQPPLYIIFSNQRYVVEKDKYIIGRSSQLADLVIRDGNVSRKHCAVIFKNGAYYIKDLDSTNGIEYKGNRIDTKRIEEGDQFNICEFHFTFTYRG